MINPLLCSPRARCAWFPLVFAAVLSSATLAYATGYPPPDPGGIGPFAVGHSTFDAIDPDRGDRKLKVDVWYPVDQEDAVGDPTVYNLVVIGPLMLGITSDNAIDDVPVAHGLPWPFILFSHGSFGINVQSILLMEVLASHGFFVASPNHTGNSTFDEPGDVPYEDVATDRPKDISFLIDFLLERGFDPADPYYLKISPFKIGVTGHSFGGFTTLAMAAGYEASAFGPVPRDSRVRAIAPVSATSGIFSDEELEAIKVPTIFIGGTLDTAVPIDPNHTRPFGLISSKFLYQVDVKDATHTHFAGICDFATLLLDLGFPPETWAGLGAGALVQPYEDTCIPPAFPLEEANRIQNQYTVAFFRWHLLADLRYQHFLTEGYTTENEPNVTFFDGSICGQGAEAALLVPPFLWLGRRRRRKTPPGLP